MSLALLGLACGRTSVGGGDPELDDPAGESGSSAGGGAATAGGGGTPTALGGSWNEGASGRAGAFGAGGPGQAGEAGAGAVPRVDFSWAVWPMPNAASSGLPNAASYDVSVPGVVTDKVTGLMWQADPLTVALPWMETKVGCEMLVLAGYDDWRLPSRIELVSLLSFESASMTDSSAFPFQSPPAWFYWSASPYAGDPSMMVWLVSGFSTQMGYATRAGGQLAARCVRSTEAPPSEPHYELLEDVVEDRWTGLAWQRRPPESWRSFDEVVAYCDSLSLSGHDDWYLPSLKELATIIDEKRAFPAIDIGTFPGTEGILSGWFWTSTRYPHAASSIPTVPGLRFSDGSTSSQNVASTLLPRCVRQAPPKVF